MRWVPITVFLMFLIFHCDGKPTSCAAEVIGPKLSKCLFILKDMMEIIKNSKELNKEKQKAYLQNCELFLDCEWDFKCFNNSEMDTAFKAVEAQCQIANFMVTEFAECDKKLTALNSTCSQTYNPFPGIKPEDVPAIIANGRKEHCEKMFREDDCMKTEIVKECGKKLWEQFREEQVKIAHAMRLCDFKS